MPSVLVICRGEIILIFKNYLTWLTDEVAINVAISTLLWITIFALRSVVMRQTVAFHFHTHSVNEKKINFLFILFV